MTASDEPSDNLGVAFASLQHSLRGYLRSRVNDAAVAEDLLQDVFVKAQIAIGANRAPDNLPGWLYAVARTTVVDYYRAKRPPAEALDDEHPDTGQIDGDKRLHQELATCMKPFVQQLPAIYRDTLLATDFDGQSMQSVANEQGVSLSAIKSRASRGRAMLKDIILDCCHVELSGGTVTDYRLKSVPAFECSCD